VLDTNKVTIPLAVEPEGPKQLMPVTGNDNEKVTSASLPHTLRHRDTAYQHN